jgi:hypothetical protein
MRRLALLLGTAPLLHASAALGWACADARAAVLESPQRAKAPLNVHLRVRFTSRPTESDLAEMTLRRRGGEAVPFRAVELPEHATPSRGDVLMELVPTRLLSPNSDYELSWKMSERAQRAFPAPWRGDVLSVGKLRTGAVADHAAPVMPASFTSAFVDRGWVRHTYKSDDPVPLTDTLRAWPQGLVRIESVADDLTPKDELYYWAWRVGAEKEAFLLTRPRMSLSGSGKGVLAIGDGEPPYECETGYAFPFPKSERRFLIAVVAVDMAGNPSEIRYVLLDRRKLKRAVPRALAPD